MGCSHSLASLYLALTCPLSDASNIFTNTPNIFVRKCQRASTSDNSQMGLKQCNRISLYDQPGLRLQITVSFLPSHSDLALSTLPLVRLIVVDVDMYDLIVLFIQIYDIGRLTLLHYIYIDIDGDMTLTMSRFGDKVRCQATALSLRSRSPVFPNKIYLWPSVKCLADVRTLQCTLGCSSQCLSCLHPAAAACVRL